MHHSPEANHQSHEDWQADLCFHKVAIFPGIIKRGAEKASTVAGTVNE